MFDYATTAAEASEVIRDAGAPLLLMKQSDGDYNAATSEVDGGSKKFAGFGVLIEYEARHINGTSILTGDVRILIAVHQRIEGELDISTQFPVPQPGDLVTLAPGTPIAETWRVVLPNTLKPGLVPVLYEVQARQ